VFTTDKSLEYQHRHLEAIQWRNDRRAQLTNRIKSFSQVLSRSLWTGDVYGWCSTRRFQFLGSNDRDAGRSWL